MYYLEPGLLVHDAGGPSAWFRLDLRRQEMLAEEDWHREVTKQVARLAAFAGMDCQLLGVHRAWGVEGWIERFTAATPDPNPGWIEGLGETADRIAGADVQRKEVYLGIALVANHRGDLVRGLLKSPEQWLSLEDPRPSGKALEALRAQTAMLRPKVAVGALGGRPASASELRWLLRRSYWRSLSMPFGEPNRITWGGDAKELLNDAVIENHHAYLHVTRPLDDVEFYCASLALAHIPSDLPDMAGDWLALQEELGWPVEFQVRFRVMEGPEATRTVERQIRPLRDQVSHLLEVPTDEIPRALAEQAEKAEDVVHRISRQHEPAVDASPRLMVAAPTLAELRDRLKLTRSHFRDEMRVELAVPTGDQLALFREFMPGSPFELRSSYRHPMSLEALAGAGALGGSHLGDSQGPYIGVTTVTGEPVTFDPHRAAELNKPTLIGIAGAPGGGKTVAAYNMALWERRRRASVVLVDPEGIPTGFADLCRQSGAVNEIRLDDPSAANVSLDPYRVLPTQEAAQLAATMLTTMLPPGMPPTVRNAIIAASSRAADEYGEQARLTLALDILLQEYGASNNDVKAAAETLKYISGWGIAESCFARADTAEIELYDALTILKFRGLPIPNASLSPERWTDQHRVATAIMHAMIALAGRIIDVGGPDHPTMSIYDDALPILSNEEGRATIERETLRGRKANHVPVIISQNASHLTAGGSAGAGQQTLISNLASAFVFRLGDPEEARAGCRLLGIPATEQNVNLLMTIGPAIDEDSDELPAYSECVFRDLSGSAGRVQLDLVTDEVRMAFNTTPGRRRGEFSAA